MMTEITKFLDALQDFLDENYYNEEAVIDITVKDIKCMLKLADIDVCQADDDTIEITLSIKTTE